MPPYLKILVLESNEADVKGIRSSLQESKMNFEIKAVDSKATFIAALNDYQPDVILANHCVKNLDAIQALELKNEKKYNVPFILVTDSVNEIFAAKIIKLGADDYILKKNLSLLPAAIESTLQEKYISPEHKIKESELLQKSLSRNTAFLNAIPDLIFVIDRQGVFTDFQPSGDIEAYTSPEHFLGKKCTEILPAQLAADTLQNIEIVLKGGTLPVHEYEMVYPDGIHEFEARYAAINENEVLTIVRDITLQKKFEQKIIKEKAVSESIINSLPGIFYIFSAQGKFLRWNKNFEKVTEYTAEEINNLHPLNLIDIDERSKVETVLANVLEIGEDTIEANILSKSGKKTFFFLTGQAIDYEGGRCIAGVGLDISERKMAGEALARNEEKFRTLVERVSDAFVALDTDWNYIYVNNKAGELLSRDPQSLVGKNIWKEFPEAIGLPFHAAYTRAMKEQQQSALSEYFPTFDKWFENNLYPSPEGLSVYFKDITQQKITEQKIVKSNRLYYFLSQFNQMIVYAENEKTLFKEACKIAVNIGKFRMAWVGIINDKTLDLEPYVYDGMEQGYLSEITVKADHSKPEGQGPSGTSIAKGKTITCNDIETDPKMALWKNAALKRNYHSNIGLPIKKFGKVIGVFTLYADMKNFFDEEEIALLEGATRNISFALEVFEKEAKQKLAEEEIIKSNKQFQNLVENISGVYWVNNLDSWETLYISPSYETIWGRKCEDLYNNPSDFLNAVHPDDKDYIRDAYLNIGNTSTTNITYRIVRPDGKIRWIAAKTKTVADSNGNKLEYGYAEDITEIKIVESELAESENRLKTILQNEPECVKLLDGKGNLLDMNPAGLAMIEADNLEMVKGKKMTSIIKKPYIAAFAELTESVFKGKHGKMEFEITGLKGTHRWLETHAVPLKNAAGEIISLLGVTRDITERKSAEENEKELTQKVLKGAEIAHFGFIDWNLATGEITLSQQANEMYGIPEDRLTYDAFISKIVHPEDVILVNENIEKALQGLKDYNIDHRIVRPDGSIKWVNARYELYRNEAGKPVRMFGTILDITDNKDAELQIKTYNEQLRLLTNHLQNIREEERSRIGREIHDELGQQLTAIKMDVSWIHKNTTDKKEAIGIKLKNIIALLDGSNQSVRKILSELRPGILDKNGLPETMEWHAKQFTATTNIPVVIKNDEPDLKLHEDIANCIFRIFQESLTNIMRYAQAKNVLISLSVIDKKIIMTIEDNGTGFDTRSVQTRKTFGILGMRERVRSLDGVFELISTPGKGTKISISLPYRP